MAPGLERLVCLAQIEQQIFTAVGADQLNTDRQAVVRRLAWQRQTGQPGGVDPGRVDGVTARTDLMPVDPRGIGLIRRPG
jgi:hypothetical protein